ncbi:unnamed protein product [Closterium sp. Naga37s-1]|nr:unnamed protein product [Closterium sp. Naga37s-1]
MVEANPEAFLRAFDHVAKQVEAARKRRTVTVTSKYNSRTDILRSALSLDIPSLSPFPAVAEGRPSSPFTRFSIAPEIGPLRLRWDRPRLVPSFGATLHSGDNSLVQIFHDLQVCLGLTMMLGALRWDRPRLVPSFGATLHSGDNSLAQIFHDLQERPSHRTALMVGWWARSMAYRALLSLKLPACHVDMLWVDFPRGEFLMNRVNGLKASLFLPCHPLRGVLQVEGRTADTATVGFAYQHPFGTRVTPSFSLADRGLSVEVLQPITVRQLGPAVKPEAQIRFKSTISGTRQGWEMETTRFLGTNEIVGGAAEASQGGLAVSVGYKAGVAPVAFFTLFGGGRRRRKTAVTGKGAGYQLRLEFPPSNLRRAVISWDATHGIDF